jgi:hypothetical protein
MQQRLLKSPPKYGDSFKVGDRVTVRSIRAKYLVLGSPTVLELANYPSLIGVPLTIESIEQPWIICTRASGSYAPGLTAEDLEAYVGKDEVSDERI